MNHISLTRLASAMFKRAFRYIRRSQLDRLPEYIAGGLTVGRDVHIEAGFSIDSSHYWHVSIGDEVTIAPQVQIIAHDASTKRQLGYTRIGKIQIGNRVFVGAGCILLPGISIGENSIIGAGSVVTSSVPSNVVAAGNPAKVICSVESFVERRRAEIASSPTFGEEYTLRGNVSLQMRERMNAEMMTGIGYVE